MPAVLLMSLGPHSLHQCRVYLSPNPPLPSEGHMSTVTCPVLAEATHSLWTSEFARHYWLYARATRTRKPQFPSQSSSSLYSYLPEGCPHTWDWLSPSPGPRRLAQCQHPEGSGAKSCPTAISRPFSRSSCSLLQARVLDSQTFPYLLQMPNGQRPDLCAPRPCNDTPSTGVPPT